MSQSTIEPWLREILACPQCKGPLTDGDRGPASASLDCPTCRLAYPIEDGAPVLLIDLALPLD